MKTKAQELGITEFPYEEFDENGNLTYFERRYGDWYKWGHDGNDNEIYWEDNYGDKEYVII
tara:strand:- start:304 stop:486 length:183 start_codon:yes stop_codon:yes gene_type:complete